MGRKLISLCLIAWIFLAMPMAVLAQEPDLDRLGSITVTLTDPNRETPLEGAELSAYYVATVGTNEAGNLIYNFTDVFSACGTALDDPELVASLDAFVQKNAIPVDIQMTDAQGTARFDDLPLGLYFVKQTAAVANYAECTPFLVTVPNHNDEGYIYDVNASPKTDIARLTAITIRKVWNTDESTSATDSVTVQLRKGDVVIETAVLSDENDWQVVYTDMPESDAYHIVEVNVPKGFVASYSRKGYVFTVTNTSYLIQTGQLIWPIPVLALAGLCLITVGSLVLRKSRDQNA